jgi:hypothetical protein
MIDSMRVSIASASFTPSRENTLSPLSAKGLWLAEIITPASNPPSCVAKASPGVVITPVSVKVPPAAAKPSATASLNQGPDSRVSRPHTTRAGRLSSAARTVATASPNFLTDCGSSGGVPAIARMPSVPNSRFIGRSCGRPLSAGTGS